MATNFPPCPPTLKPIMHYLKVAAEHDERNPVIAYWCRLHALQVGIKLSAGRKNRDETNLLGALMDWLETQKKELANNEAVTNDMCAQAAIEEYVLKIFKYADEQDRAENFNKNLVKAFYTCGIVMDVLVVFGELPEDILEKQKYAKWKAAYIHNCLRNGERPIAGPIGGQGGDLDEGTSAEDDINAYNAAGFVTPGVPPTTYSDDVPKRPSSPTPSNQSRNSPPAGGSMVPPGFHPYIPAPSTSYNVPTTPTISPTESNSLPSLDADQVTKVKKYCKFASSALDYDDNKTAVLNLQKALALLQTGRDIA